MNSQALLEGVLGRQPASLARAISEVENGEAGAEELLGSLHSRLGHARRIGITGPPGAGKSTITEQLTEAFRRSGLTVGIVAVDPSSPFTGGALLGDRIRMERSSLDEGVFIRSMASRGSVGGMATATGEVADVMDAYGFDRILIETVGVGQTGLDVAAAADTTMVVLVPESGDGIQVMKAGLMEIADIFVVNKADRPGADRIRQELEVALGLKSGQVYRHVRAHHGVEYRRTDAPTHGRTDESAAGPASTSGASVGRSVGALHWEPPVLTTIASKGEGIAGVVAALDRHFAHLEATGQLAARRKRRLEVRTREVVERAVRRWLWSDGERGELEALLRDVAAGTRSPYEAAAGILARLAGSEAYERR